VTAFADYLEAAKRNLESATPGLVTSPNVAEKYFGEESLKRGMESPNVSELRASSNSFSHTKHNILQRLQARVVSELILYSQFYPTIVIPSLKDE